MRKIAGLLAAAACVCTFLCLSVASIFAGLAKGVAICEAMIQGKRAGLALLLGASERGRWIRNQHYSHDKHAKNDEPQSDFYISSHIRLLSVPLPALIDAEL